MATVECKSMGGRRGSRARFRVPLLARSLFLVLAVAAAAGRAPAQAQEDSSGVEESEGQSNGTPPQNRNDESPLAHSLSPWGALGIGALGSLAYLLAAYLGFIGIDTTARSRILQHFGGRRRLASATKVVAYGAVGAGVAMVFQLTEHNLVPVQAFILGCTWPAVVANYLSSRQQGSDEAVEARVASAMRQEEEQAGLLETLPSDLSGGLEGDRQEEFDRLLELLPPEEE